MSEEETDFDAEFEALAAKIAKQACETEALMDKVDAMKALQPYYALRKKNRPPGTKPGTMDDLRNRIKAVANEEDSNADAA